ncbi:unnamed protein product, partial [Gulo gulo]
MLRNWDHYGPSEKVGAACPQTASAPTGLGIKPPASPGPRPHGSAPVWGESAGRTQASPDPSGQQRERRVRAQCPPPRGRRGP